MTTMDKVGNNLEHIALETLIPYARNSRTHSDAQVAQIAASIKEFGFNKPDTHRQRRWHHCWSRSHYGGTQVGAGGSAMHTTVKPFGRAKRKPNIIADNKLALNAGWMMKCLKVELTELKDLDFDLSLIGFDADELANLLEPEQVDGLTDEDDVPEAPETPVTVEGDVWILGNHRLMCGDSCSQNDMDKLTSGQLVDMWLTDPPYNVAYEGKTKDALKIQNDSMADEDFRTFLRDACVTADTVMKAGAVFYIWHADSEGYNFRGACQDAGWKVRQCLIWKKSSLVMGRQDYHWRHELCLYGWKEGAGHLWSADRKQTTILEFDKPARNGEHPTMKPVALFEYQMLNNTKGGDIVLDSFGGSGTTLIAAEKNGRFSRVMELDPKYCDVIVKRWQEFTGKQAVHEVTGEAFTGVAHG